MFEKYWGCRCVIFPLLELLPLLGTSLLFLWELLFPHASHNIHEWLLTVSPGDPDQANENSHPELFELSWQGSTLFFDEDGI